HAILVYPNPYSGETQISYSLNKDAHVLIEVHNVLGEVIAVLANEEQRSGGYKYYFGAVGKGYANGVYLVKLTVNGESFVKRIVELK
ncbi:MAG TPA: T9SS type A sorting domain-containing protein, partial [Flavobacteriales bacterium]|nr:T9SS type A sorting domain-containing protein [Flavobacteriales bacterium]